MEVCTINATEGAGNGFSGLLLKNIDGEAIEVAFDGFGVWA